MKKKLSLLVGVLMFVSYQTLQAQDETFHQLRMYEIYKDNKAAFHERFRDHAMTIMKKYGFSIVAIWESEQDNHIKFIYLLEWKSKSEMTDGWAKFKSDQEWIDIKKQYAAKYGELVGEIEDLTLIVQSYSPRKTLLK